MSCTERKLHHNPHQPVGRWIRVERRLALYLRDSCRCVWCEVDLSSSHCAGVTLDHLERIVDGGSNDSGNLYTSCRSCNSSRSRGTDSEVDLSIVMGRLEARRGRLVSSMKASKEICRGLTYQDAFKVAQSTALILRTHLPMPMEAT